MPTVGTERLAVFWRAIQEQGRITERSFRALLPDDAGAAAEGLVPTPGDGLRMAFQRTGKALKNAKYPIRREGDAWIRDHSLEIEEQETLTLVGEEVTVRRYVQSTLANWDTTNRINFDPTLIAKSFLHQPIRITYGDGFYAGLPYRQNHQGRSVFCLRTDEGDLGFYCDAVSRYEPRRGEAVRVADGDPQPPVIPADPVDRFELANRHGRPTNIDQWRNVQRLRGVLAASSNADSIVPWKDLEDVTGISREEIERLLPSLERLDPRFQKAEDGIAFDLDSESLREELLGIDAAGLRLALESLKSLGAGREEVLEDLAEAADLLEARLDIFLNRFSLSTETRVAPCGANVVAAIGALPERFVVRGHRDPVDLEVQGLTWDGSNWWILGQANREELLPGGLCLEDVLEWVDS